MLYACNLPFVTHQGIRNIEDKAALYDVRMTILFCSCIICTFDKDWNMILLLMRHYTALHNLYIVYKSFSCANNLYY